MFWSIGVLNYLRGLGVGLGFDVGPPSLLPPLLLGGGEGAGVGGTGVHVGGGVRVDVGLRVAVGKTVGVNGAPAWLDLVAARS